MTERLFVPVAEAATLVGISERSYYRKVESGELPGRRIGGRIMVSVPALEAIVGELAGFVTIEEAAALLGISPSSYRRGVRRGEFPEQRIGGRRVVALASLRQMAQGA